MAGKKITEVTNPLTASGGNILNPADWISRVLYVAWFGAIFMIGAKVLTMADRVIPGNVTPNDYKTQSSVITGDGVTVL